MITMSLVLFLILSIPILQVAASAVFSPPITMASTALTGLNSGSITYFPQDNGFPAGTFYSADSVSFFYVSCGSADCSSFTITSPSSDRAGAGRAAAAILGSDNLPWILFSGDSTLHFVHCGNMDCIDTPTETNTLTTLVANGQLVTISSVSLSIASDNNPQISYVGKTNKLEMIHCTSIDCSTSESGWVKNNFVQSHSRIHTVTNPLTGFPITAYHNQTGSGSDQALYLLNCLSSDCVSYETINVDPAAGISNSNYAWPRITFIGNNPIIIYGATTSELIVVSCTTNDCSSGVTITPIPAALNFYSYPRIIPSTSGTADILFSNSTQFVYLHCLNFACTSYSETTISSTSPPTFFDFQLGSNTFGSIFWADSSIDTLFFLTQCTNVDCSSFSNIPLPVNLQASDISDMSPTLVIDNSPNYSPFITMRDEINQNLVALYCTDMTCKQNAYSFIDTVGDTGHSPYAIVGNSSLPFPIIAYIDSTTDSLKMARCYDPICGGSTVINVIESGTSPAKPSMALGDSGYPVIAFSRNGAIQDIVLAICTDADCSTPTIKVVNALPYTSSVPPGVSIKYYNGNPSLFFSYSTSDNNPIRFNYTRCHDPQCNSVTFKDDINSPNQFILYQPPSLHFIGGKPVITATNRKTSLMLITCGDIDCSTYTMKTQLGVLYTYNTGFTSELGKSGRLTIMYRDWLTDQIQIGSCTNFGCVSDPVPSVTSANFATVVTPAYSDPPMMSFGVIPDSDKYAIIYVDHFVGTINLFTANVYCEPGQKLAPDGICYPCDPGTYSSGYSSGSACTICGVAQYTSSSGSTSCQFCDPGYAATSKLECEPCTNGTYSPGSVDKCTNCPPGQYTLNTTNSACTEVDFGTYSVSTTSPGTPCALGYYQDQKGQSYCKPCSVTGTFTNETGSLFCSSCPAGYFSANPSTGCQPCPLGTYQSIPGKSMCIECPLGTNSASEGSTECLGCPPGQFSNPTTPCQLCNPDEYSPANATECSSCSLGYLYNSTSLSCEPCPPNHILNSNRTECVACPPGTWANGVSCNSCPARTYVGPNTCFSCPLFRNSPINSTGIEDCMCEPGYYDPQPLTHSDNCLKCPLGGSCAGNYSQPVADDGSFPSIDVDNAFISCPYPSRCLGNGECAPGYDGFLCSDCVPDYYAISGTCRPCSNLQSVPLIFGSIGLFFLLGVFILINSRGHKFGALAMIVEYLQFFSLFGHIQISGPELWEATFAATSFAMFDVSAFAPECASSNLDFYTINQIQLLLPFIVVGIYIIYFFLLKFFKTQIHAFCLRLPVNAFTVHFQDSSSLSTNISSLITGSILYTFVLIHLIVCRAVFSLLDCELLSDGSHVLGSQPSLSCEPDDPKYVQHVWLAWVMLFLFSLGLPVFIIYVYFLNKKTLRDSEEYDILKIRFGSFIDKYTPTHAYWEAVVCLRKLFVTGLVELLSSTPFSSTALIFCALSFFQLIHIRISPYWTDELNHLQSVSLFFSLVTVFLAFSLIGVTSLSTKTLELLTPDTIAVLNVLCLVVCLCFLFYFTRKQAKKWKLDIAETKDTSFEFYSSDDSSVLSIRKSDVNDLSGAQDGKTTVDDVSMAGTNAKQSLEMKSIDIASNE